ncbi:MAG: ribosome small subunit-dependent GTPase A [Planctomycetota bacterium]|jgi:ribosome biogenesis GTPase|nr:ribosome small subunit-dependent GTPase A [Planctomycetota bacterium]MDP6937288.1 ribosome small subunit-dependent GTPase A [Planctomycetota bacterium]
MDDAPQQTQPGRVLRVDAKVCHVQVEAGVIQASPRGHLFENLEGRKNPIAVGDFVDVSLEGTPVAIESVHERRNYLGRTASSHDPREQILVANADQLFIVSSLQDPGFSSNRTDRILAACIWHEIPVVLVINKIDLSGAGDLEDIRRTYEAVPIEVIETCAVDGRGVDILKDRMRDKVSVLYGPSGAGKSTLINAVQPGLNLREGKISSYWKQGKHTTSYSQLIPLEMGGWVIDTPGIRVFRLHGLKRNLLRDLFPEFERIQNKCHFDGCSHDHEPDCGVFDAVDRGELAASRYASYVEMLDEIDPDNAYDPAEEEPL